MTVAPEERKNLTTYIDADGVEHPSVVVDRVKNYKPKRLYEFVKRISDILLSLVALVILLIPMAIVAIVIVIDSPGNPIFKQERLGRNEKPFTIYKFRSMRLDAEADGPKWADEDDPRCTKVGKFIRSTRIDELPQLINILKGDMSIVGPRPERPEFYDVFDTYIDGFRQRMMVPPGVTGWAQVNGGYNLYPEEKIIYDVEYIEKRGLRMDCICVLKTIHVVFTHEGAR